MKTFSSTPSWADVPDTSSAADDPLPGLPERDSD